MIPDHYQPLCDEHNRRVLGQVAQARTRLLGSAFGLSNLVFLLLLLVARWVGCPLGRLPAGAVSFLGCLDFA